MIARALLPGPVHARPAEPGARFRWLDRRADDDRGPRAEAGTRREVLDRVGVVAATSANRHGKPDPARLDDVPEAITRAAAARGRRKAAR